MKAAVPRRGFYGWWALVGGMFVYFIACGCYYYSYGVLAPRWIIDYHIPVPTVSLAYMLFALMIGLPGPLIGYSLVRWGPRRTIFGGTLAGALGLFLLSTTVAPWAIILFFGLLVGLGFGFAGYTSVTTLANNWFVRRRGLAMGLVLGAGGLGGFVFSPLISWMAINWGIRTALIVLAVCAIVLAGGGTLLLIRNRPEDLGQYPDGIPPQPAKANPAPSSNPAARVIDWTAREAFRSFTLWMVVIIGAANGWALGTVVAHQVTHFELMGIPKLVAAGALGLVPGMSVLGRLTYGPLTDRFAAKWVTVGYLVLELLAVILLFFARSVGVMYLYAILFGLAYGGLLVAWPVLIGLYFGRRYYAQILGWVLPVTTILMATAPLVGGLLFTAAGGVYTITFIVVMAFVAAGLVAALLLRRPVHPSER